MDIHQLQDLFGKPLSEYAKEPQQHSPFTFVLKAVIVGFALYGIYRAIEDLQKKPTSN